MTGERLSLGWGLRRRRWVLGVLGGVTLLLGFGVPNLRVETGLLDWLPSGQRNVAAFRSLLTELPGAVNQELIWLELDDEKARARGVDSIVDPESLYAQEELILFLRSHVPGIVGEFGVLPVLRAVAGTLSRGAVKDGRLPTQPGSVGFLWQLLDRTPAGKFVGPFISRDRRGTILAVMLEGTPLSEETRARGLVLQEALRSYANKRDKVYDLFQDEHLLPVGLSSGIARMDAALAADLQVLSPVALAFLIVLLRALVGPWRFVGLICGVLLTSTIWTLGLMGWAGVTLNIVTVAIVPLVLGCGVDYAVLISVEVEDRRRSGLRPSRVLREVAQGPVLAILLTTATTVCGLAALIPSDSPGISALGLYAAAGMAVSGGLAGGVLPILLLAPSVLRRRRPGRASSVAASTVPSRLGLLLEAVTTRLARHRVSWLLGWGGAVAVCILVLRDPITSLDLIEGNFPPSSPVARAAREMRERCGGAFPEIVIARGNLRAPGAVDILRRIQSRIEASEVLGWRFRVAGLPDVLALSRVGSMLTGSLPDPTEGSADPADEIGRLYSSDLWASLARLFVSPQGTIGTLLLVGGDAGGDEDSVGRIWKELETIIAEGVPEGAPIEVSFLGFRTMSYLFVTYSRWWLRVAAIVSLGVVTLLVGLFLRRWSAVLLVVALALGSFVLWLGLLQAAGIYISMFLVFPLVFCLCVGSDYALHLLCGLRALETEHFAEDLEPAERHLRVWRMTGRAIAAAALTDAGVFLVYSRMTLTSAADVMTAVVLAVVAVFVSTIILVSCALPRGRASLRPPPTVP